MGLFAIISFYGGAGKMLMETQHTDKFIHTKSEGKENGV